MPRVSVIMGIYNTNNETLVKPAIDSILNQTYTDFEFIICDDGSNDGTLELVRKITNHDSRVKIIENITNKGLASTLNNCLEISKGDYIARMDADDISLPHRLEKQVEFLDNNLEYDLVGCNAVLFDENGDWGYRRTEEYPKRNHFLFGTPFIHPSILIRSATIKEMNGYKVAKETLRCEDYELFMRLYSKEKKGYNLQEHLFKFRENQEAYNRRKLKFRLDEAKVRYRGFKMLDLMPIGLIYTIKPLIVGLVPQKVLAFLRQER
ncbi:glycosyltransferase [Fictibacillus sp. WQ 8-8]|uniref:glycosyltransferase family 2 protein n=1 Tax=Fictibacillus sp. WQ 8-8 TaxID=2938788 RepID=UPI00210CCE75|nr:glycosyltransferase [Fictibacillus sp. WQ 8-8]MCQ6264731.1 glycosyltransferase [Fictibacillus sp. WQ 8-8]